MRGSPRSSYFVQPRGMGYNSTRGRYGDRYATSGGIRDRELEAMARQQEMLRMETERERLRFEREQIARERLQLEQMRQIQMAAPIAAAAAAPYQRFGFFYIFAEPFEFESIVEGENVKIFIG